MSRARRQAERGARQADRPPEHDQPRRAPLQLALPGLLVIIVAAIVVAAHWPVLSARALSFDDGQFLTDNPLVRNPSWTSPGRFLGEVLEPSTVEGYYLPLSMISLMLDHAMGGRPDNLGPFHRTSLALHAINTALVIVLLYSLFGQPFPDREGGSRMIRGLRAGSAGGFVRQALILMGGWCVPRAQRRSNLDRGA